MMKLGSTRLHTQIYYWLLGVLIAGLIAGCGSATQEAPASSPQFAEESAVMDRAVEAEAPLPPNDNAGELLPVENVMTDALAQAQGPRVIIYTGNISLVVMDTRQSVQTITILANEQGGYVSNANIYQYDEVPRGSITIRVPAEKYEETLTRLRAMAIRVESENTGTQDVTEEFVDLEARKTNLEHTEAALQKLLDDRQQLGRTSDILEVHRELTNIRGQIEQIEGRMRYLANQAALSTITVELTPDVLYQPVSVAGWEPQGVAKEALQALVVALQGLVNLLIWLVILVLPLLVIALVPLIAIILIARWWWQRRQARKKVTAPSEKSSGESTG
jgi:hypothetical protein